MALIACPVCSKQISDLAPVCPGCGHPLKPARSCRHGWLLGCGCLLAGCFAFLLAIVIGLLIWIGVSLQPFEDEEFDPEAPSVSTAFDEQRYLCQEHLEEIALIKEEWATAHDAKQGTVIAEADAEKLFAETGKKLVCPKDDERSFKTSYDIGPIGTDPRCKCDEKHNEVDEDEK